MEELQQVFNQYPIDINCALDVYAKHIHRTNPTRTERLNIHKALTVFSEYWKLYHDHITDTTYLSSLATVFVDELLFTTEYDQVCAGIKESIDSRQKMGRNSQKEWRNI